MTTLMTFATFLPQVSRSFSKVLPNISVEVGQAEFCQLVANYEAGTLRVVPSDYTPMVGEELVQFQESMEGNGLIFTSCLGFVHNYPATFWVLPIDQGYLVALNKGAFVVGTPDNPMPVNFNYTGSNADWIIWMDRNSEVAFRPDPEAMNLVTYKRSFFDNTEASFRPISKQLLDNGYYAAREAERLRVQAEQQAAREAARVAKAERDRAEREARQQVQMMNLFRQFAPQP